MKTCRSCHQRYTKEDVEEVLEAMFGSDVDEDYLVHIYGWCPECWPEYN